jgi:hypothetical protein
VHPIARSRIIIASVVAIAIALSASAFADTHFVDAAGAKPAAPYATGETAAHDIQSAIDAAEEGDTVEVAAGNYDIDKMIDVKKGITLHGAGAGETTIDAGGTCAVIRLGRRSTVAAFTITGGKARAGAGATCGQGSTLSGCTITGNEAERYGGGIYARIEGKSPERATVRNCVIAGNRVTAFMHTDTPWGGGGVYAAGAVSVIGCLIEGNEAQQRAGGIWLHGGGTLAENCVIRDNRALGKRARNPNGSGSMEEGGGGAYCDFGGQLRNSLITGNHGGKIGGGAVLSTNGRAKSCTIFGNTAGASGGGVQTLGPGHVVNSIVVGNTRGAKPGAESGEADDVFVSHYYHVDAHQLMLGKAQLRHACIGTTRVHHTTRRFHLGRTAGYDPKNYKNTVNEVMPVEGDPKFADAAKGDFRLIEGSPCVGAGLAEDWMKGAKDLAGQVRVRNGSVDVGAYGRSVDG